MECEMEKGRYEVDYNKLETLSEFYDQNMIGFFPQGPGVVFVYWELSGSQWEVVVRLGGIMILKVYRLTGSGETDCENVPVREVELPPYTNSWYFNGLDPDSSYIADVGCRLPDGGFLSIVKSGKTTTPPVPRFDAMPRLKVPAGGPVAKAPEKNPRVKEGDLPGKGISLGEVLESMPFYMGYHTQLTG